MHLWFIKALHFYLSTQLPYNRKQSIYNPHKTHFSINCQNNCTSPLIFYESFLVLLLQIYNIYLSHNRTQELTLIEILINIEKFLEPSVYYTL